MTQTQTPAQPSNRCPCPDCEGARADRLRAAANKVARALALAPDPARRKRGADAALGFWMAAALDDKTVCDRMKHDINEWFEATEHLDICTKLARLLAIAQIELRASEPRQEFAVAQPGLTREGYVEPTVVEPDTEDAPSPWGQPFGPHFEFIEGDVVTIERDTRKCSYLVTAFGPMCIGGSSSEYNADGQLRVPVASP